MSAITYAAFADRMIHKYEGGYGWNHRDPGGPTNFGITCFDLAEFMGQKMDSMSRWAPIVKAMPLSTAEAIYKKKYATALRYDDLPAGVDACMLDYGVNSGTSRAILSACAILKLPTTRVMTQPLLDAIKKVDPVAFVDAMCAERLHFMHAIKGGAMWATFGGGWGARVADLKAYCTHLAQGGAATAGPAFIDLSNTIQPKATHVGTTAAKTTGGLVIATATAAQVAGFPWYYALGAAVLTVVAGVVYEAISSGRAGSANSTVVIPPSVTLPTIPAIPAI
jgi:lysozyme family protein